MERAPRLKEPLQLDPQFFEVPNSSGPPSTPPRPNSQSSKTAVSRAGQSVVVAQVHSSPRKLQNKAQKGSHKHRAFLMCRFPRSAKAQEAPPAPPARPRISFRALKTKTRSLSQQQLNCSPASHVRPSPSPRSKQTRCLRVLQTPQTVEVQLARLVDQPVRLPPTLTVSASAP